MPQSRAHNEASVHREPGVSQRLQRTMLARLPFLAKAKYL